MNSFSQTGPAMYNIIIFLYNYFYNKTHQQQTKDGEGKQTRKGTHARTHASS
jgi:hypothetical protein